MPAVDITVPLPDGRSCRLYLVAANLAPDQLTPAALLPLVLFLLEGQPCN